MLGRAVLILSFSWEISLGFTGAPNLLRASGIAIGVRKDDGVLVGTIEEGRLVAGSVYVEEKRCDASSTNFLS